jgi:hypothetical protein
MLEFTIYILIGAILSRYCEWPAEYDSETITTYKLIVTFGWPALIFFWLIGIVSGTIPLRWNGKRIN